LWYCFQNVDNVRAKLNERPKDMTDATAAKKTNAPKKAPNAQVNATKSADKGAAKAVIRPAVPAPKVAIPVLAEGSVAVADKSKGATLKMKDLIAQVTEAAGGKKKGVKEIVEATLAALSAALAKGDAINLPGFGRAKVAHAEDKGAGKPMTIKLKSQVGPRAKNPGKEGLADNED
jgi:nucleoid DNA-binding protein